MHGASIELARGRNVLVGARNRQWGRPSRIVIFLPVSPGISRRSPAYLAECFGLFVFGRAASTMAGGSREGRTTIMSGTNMVVVEHVLRATQAVRRIRPRIAAYVLMGLALSG
jgi:hypothetical protein